MLPDACHLMVHQAKHIPLFQNLTNLRTNLRCLNVKLYFDRRLLSDSIACLFLFYVIFPTEVSAYIASY